MFIVPHNGSVGIILKLFGVLCPMTRSSKELNKVQFFGIRIDFFFWGGVGGVNNFLALLLLLFSGLGKMQSKIVLKI